MDSEKTFILSKNIEDTTSLGVSSSGSVFVDGNVTLEELNSADLPKVGAQYENVEFFAEGGLATVSRAYDRYLKRCVALKSLKCSFLEDEEIKKSFVSEAQLTSQLDHPAIVPIYSIDGDSAEGLHLAMKLISGSTLKDFLQNLIIDYNRKGFQPGYEKKSLRERLDVFLRVCDAVAYAHGKNIMHCDLKPENIMLGEYHETYVMDWGIARRIVPEADGMDWHIPKTICGTPKYISPEAVSGKRTDQRSDIFSLGLILFELVTLKSATIGSDSQETMANIRDGILESVQHRYKFKIPKDLKAVIEKATQRLPEERYQSVEALSDDIRKYLSNQEVSANPDNLFEKGMRRIYANGPLVTMISLAFLFLGAVFIALGLYWRAADAEDMRFRDAITDLVYGKTASAAISIDRWALSIEKSLEAVSDSAAFLAAYGRSFPNTRYFFSSDLKSRQGDKPPDFAYSPAYGTRISVENLVVKFAPGGDRDSRNELLARLQPLRRTFSGAVMESKPDTMISTGNLASLKHELFQVGMPAKWIYAAFENGLFLAYPASGTHPENYDPRERSWYLDAAKKRGVRWSKPHYDVSGQGLVSACVTQIVGDDGKFRGVIGMDLSLSMLAAALERVGNSGYWVKDKMLVSSEGEVIVSRKMDFTSRRTRLPDNLPAVLTRFPDSDLFQLIRRRKSGVCLRSENDRTILYSFLPITSTPCVYVEKIDFSELYAAGKNKKLF